MKNNILIERFRGFRGGFRGRIGNYVNNAEYTYNPTDEIDKKLFNTRPDTYSQRLKNDMKLIQEMNKKSELVNKIYDNINNDKKNQVKNIIETSKFENDISEFIKKYNNFKSSNIDTKQIELNDKQKKELLLKYYPLFKSNQVDTNIFSEFLERLKSKINLKKSSYLENYIDIFFKTNNDLLRTDRSNFYIRIIHDSKYKIDFENKLKYVENFKTKIDQLNLNNPELPNTLKYNFEEKDTFTKKNLKFFETFMISYLAMFNIYVNGYFNTVINENDPEYLPSVERFSNQEISKEDLNNFAELIIITHEKKKLLKDILDFKEKNVFTKTQIQNLENMLYDRLKKLDDTIFDELIHELNFPDNLFEATDDQIVILSELNNYDYERRLSELETLLLMREFYIKLDDNDKDKFFKLNNLTKTKVIINWINKDELDKDIIEEDVDLIDHNINYVKNTYNDIKTDLDKNFSSINKKFIIILVIVFVILIGLYMFFKRKPDNSNNFDDF